MGSIYSSSRSPLVRHSSFPMTMSKPLFRRIDIFNIFV